MSGQPCTGRGSEREQRVSSPVNHASIRARSFGGCSTCRLRHMKCDETRPSCQICSNSNIACGGYERCIFFELQESEVESTKPRHRRPLFSDAERETMVNSITAQVKPSSASRCISWIESRCDSCSDDQEMAIQRGPFGAFRLVDQSPSIDLSNNATRSDLHSSDADNSLDDGGMGSSECSPTQTARLPPVRPLSDLEIGILPDEPWSMTLMNANDSDLQEVMDWDMTIGPISPVDMSTSLVFNETTLNLDPLTWPYTSVNSIPPELSFGHSLPVNAVLFIKHYSVRIADLVTTIRDNKTPWHILFIPNVKNCLASMTLGDDLSAAAQTAFFGALAISAFSLGRTTGHQPFLEEALAYQRKALESSRKMISVAYDFPKQSKYKEILMGLLTMVQGSMFAGDRRQAEGFFLETEKFIRLRGLNRKKSRKVRLLHHCYAFERIFHETTALEHADPYARQQISQIVEGSGVIVPHQDRMNFRLPSWVDLDNEMTRIKTREESENDLHLEHPGFWSDTLYPEIFGMPESMLLLLSQVVRLNNEKNTAERNDQGTNLGIKEFHQRAKALERQILRATPDPPCPQDPTAREDDGVHNLTDTMLIAMHSALSIFFYRRIHDIDRSLIQPQAIQISTCLCTCNQIQDNVMHSSTRFIWPAYIGACEAQDVALRLSFSTWFENCSKSTGLSMFDRTMEEIKLVWQEIGG